MKTWQWKTTNDAGIGMEGHELKDMKDGALVNYF